jgi:hypothetical protein
MSFTSNPLIVLMLLVASLVAKKTFLNFFLN